MMHGGSLKFLYIYIVPPIVCYVPSEDDAVYAVNQRVSQPIPFPRETFFPLFPRKLP